MSNCHHRKSSFENAFKNGGTHVQLPQQDLEITAKHVYIGQYIVTGIDFTPSIITNLIGAFSVPSKKQKQLSSFWYKYRNNHVKELTNKLELDVRTEDGARLFCCDG